ALYGMSRYKTEHEKPDSYRSYRQIYGRVQEVYFINDKMPSKELNILALKYAWHLHQIVPTDEEINLICNSLFNDISTRSKLNSTDFKTALPEHFSRTCGVSDTKMFDYDEYRLHSDSSKEKNEVPDS